MLLLCTVVGLACWSCGATPMNVTVHGDASMIGASVLIDGHPAGVMVADTVSRPWIVEAPRDSAARYAQLLIQRWPGQSVGDTVFRAGDQQAIWSAALERKKHLLICRNATGAELRQELDQVASVITLLASFRRNYINMWVESY